MTPRQHELMAKYATMWLGAITKLKALENPTETQLEEIDYRLAMLKVWTHQLKHDHTLDEPKGSISASSTLKSSERADAST